MPNQSDALLYVLTDHECMSWTAFRGVFDYLDAQCGATHFGPFKELRNRRWRTVRALEALAHAEFDFDGDGAVRVTPSVLARLPQSGLPRAVLTGARSPDAIAQITTVIRAMNGRVQLSVLPQTDVLPLLPRRVTVQAESVDVLATVARTLGVRFEANPPAWVIAQFTGSLENYLETCTWSGRREMNWERTDFDPSRLQFRSGNGANSCRRLSRYRHPARGTTEFVLWHDGSGAQVDPDWGRYAILQALNFSVLTYDAERFVLAVPSGAPLPRLLSRALALCSGFAPRFVAADRVPGYTREHWGFELYRSVPPQVAEAVASCLGQHIERCMIASTLMGDAT